MIAVGATAVAGRSSLRLVGSRACGLCAVCCREVSRSRGRWCGGGGKPGARLPQGSTVVQVADLRARLQAREAEMAALIDDINAAAPPPRGVPAAGFDSEDIAAAAGPPVDTPTDNVDAGKQARREGGAEGGSLPDAGGAGGAAGSGRDRSTQGVEARGEGGREALGKAVQWLLRKLPRPWGK